MQPDDASSPLDGVLLWGARLLALVAMGLSAYLWYAGTQQTPVAGCDYFSAFDCDAALGSRWAKWFGVPVSALGALTYMTILVGTMLVAAGGTATLGWRLLEAACVAAIGAAVWFMAVQFTALESFCLYCVVTHLCGIACATLLLIVRHRRARAIESPLAAGLVGVDSAVRPSGPPPLGAPLALGVLGVAALAAGQLFGAAPGPRETASFEAPADLEIAGFDQAEPDTPPSPPTSEPADNQTITTPTPSPRESARSVPRRKKNGSRSVSFFRDRLKIDAYAHPVVGSPEAPHLVLELMDYACPHCRAFHELMTEALQRRRGQIAVVVMPVPGEILCNPYVKRGAKERRGACKIAKLSLAVSELAPQSFEPMHRWLLEGDRLPNYTSALIKAQQYCDRDELSVKVRDENGEIAARVKRHIELYATLASIQKVGLPIQVLGSDVYSGGVESVDRLLEIWDKKFDLDPTDFGEPPHDTASGE